MTGVSEVRLRPSRPEPQQIAKVGVAYCSYRFLRNANFSFPLTTAFFAAHGVPFSAFLLLDAVYFVSKLFTETPNGHLADRFGRRLMAFVGCVTFSGALLLAVFDPSVTTFLLSQAITGYAQGIQRSVAAAYLYDWLKCVGRTELYGRIEAYGQSATNASQAFASVVGGVIATFTGISGAWIATALAGLAAAIPLTMLPSDTTVRQNSVASPRTLYNALKSASAEIRANRELQQTALIYATLFVATRFGFWSLQAVLAAHQVGLLSFGTITFAVYAIASASGFAIRRCDFRQTRSLSLILMGGASLFLLSIGVSFHLDGLSFAAGLTICLTTLGIVYGCYNPIVLTWLNSLIGSKERATNISALSSLASITYVAFAIGMNVTLYLLPIAAAIVVLSMGLMSIIALTIRLYTSRIT